MDQNINQRRIGALISYISVIANVLVSLLYTPLMIRVLGRNEYGLYNTITSTVSMLSVLSLGFSSSYIRFYAPYKEQGDHENIEKINGLFLLVFLIISLIAIVCGTYLITHLSLVFGDGLTEDEYGRAKVLMIILIVNLAISFPMTVFSCIIAANERFIFMKLVGMIRTILSPLLTLPLLFLGYGSIGIVAITLAVALSVDISYVFYVIVKLKQRFKIGEVDKKIVKSLFVYTSFIAINLIIDQINTNIDKVLLGRYCGTAEVALYSTGFTLFVLCQAFSSNLSEVFKPQVHLIANTKMSKQDRTREFTNLFTKVGRIQLMIIGLIDTGIILFGKSFIILWVGNEFEMSYYVALLLVIPASIAMIQNIGVEIQRALDKHRFRSIAYLIMAVLNLVLSIILCQKYGSLGCAFGTAVSFIIANGLIMNCYYHRQCCIDIILFWKNTTPMLIAIIGVLLLGMMIRAYVSINNWGMLIFGCLCYASIYCLAMWLYGMNNEEKKQVTEIIKGEKRRRKNV